MKLTQEPVQLSRGTSFTVFEHNAVNPCPVSWHHHAEYELLYLPQGTGRRHVGCHSSRYEDGELLLLGPNVPHLSYGYGQAASDSFAEVGVQFRADLLGGTWLDLPEFRQVRGLLARARSGLVFAAPVRHVVGQQLLALRHHPPLERLLTLLHLLQQLALVVDYSVLAAGPPVAAPVAQDRLNRVLRLLDQRLPGPVSVPELAGEAALSVPAFCRFFKSMTQRTLTEFVNECRVQHACRLLLRPDSVTEVGHASGFPSLSYFNRTFRRLTGLSPSVYRRTMTEPGSSSR